MNANRSLEVGGALLRKNLGRSVMVAALFAGGALVAAASDGQGPCVQVSADPAAGGTVLVSVADPCPAAGTSITFTAVPAAGYTFGFWSEASSGTDLSVTLSVPAGTSGESGNELSLEAHFAGAGSTFDDSASVDGLSDGEGVSGEVDVHLSEVRPGDLSSADFYLDGALKASDNSAPFDYAFDSRSLDAGRHRLDISIRDSAGVSSAKSIQFTAAAAPVVSYVRVTDEMGVTTVKVGGTGLGAGSQILVAGAPLKTKYNARKGALVSTGGNRLNERFNGTVCVTVKNPDGQQSSCYSFTK